TLDGDLRLLARRPQLPYLAEQIGPLRDLDKGVFHGLPDNEAKTNDPYRPLEIPGALPGPMSLSIVTHVSTPDTFDNYLPEAYAASGQSLLGGEEDDFWIRPNWSYIEAGNIVGKRFAFTSIAQ